MYVNYPQNTMVQIIETGEKAEAFESALGYISVFIDGIDKAVILKLDEVIFLEQ